MDNTRKYLPTFSELIDRLSIVQLKEVFIIDNKEAYAKEIKDMVHDLNLILDANKKPITAEHIRAIIALSQLNLHIWHNESKARSSGDLQGSDLALTHGLNGLRNTAKNKIEHFTGGREDFKIDCLAAEFKDWEISW